MKFVQSSPLLKWALGADAMVSGAVAVLQIAAAGLLAEWLGLPRMLLLGTGVFLVGYMALLLMLARQPRVPVALIALVIAGNLLWAVGALGLLTASTLAPSALGTGFVLLHVATVLFFGTLEWAGLQRSEPVASGMPARA